MNEPLPQAIPAATLIVLREGADLPEILMVERAQAMAFAAGALVFPGGRIDAGDHAIASGTGDEDEAAARVAAVRETIEEAGVAVGIAPLPDAERIATMRAALHGGVGLAAALAMVGGTLDLAALVPFARWRPAHRHLRIYDTRFYLARLPAGAAPATVDATENTRLFWASAHATLAMVDAGEAAVIFPTRRNLERLARFTSIDQAFADAAAHPIETVTPWIEERGGVAHLCIPDHLGYPVTAERLDTTRRG